MTKNEFNAACTEYTIDPALALEDRDILAAIHQNDIDAVKDALRDNF